MQLQSVPAPKFQLFQEVSVQPSKPVILHGKLFQIPRPERAVIVGMNYTPESYAEFFNASAGWHYLVDGDFEMSAAEAATAQSRWELECFNEDELTLLGAVAAVEVLAA
ncbi:MAG: hypothetical protein KME07_06450 [Pegethrix bostrychoides GSE-TBD4-15B]|jgi:hypothetical protein|uniref:Uncharacterized protein n=1 Tax=Pegethrix bostrychoides GSE-TBD4-15B TaxID=2839662 RepID=A0A951P9Y7_9CYAN|nr:hypothetical protein [Pegethrix bostrychoides GSE-TBD4-15B]